jgi:pyruvate kinase
MIPKIHFNQYHGEVIKNLREALKQTPKRCAIMLDTKGPEIRTGKLKNKILELQKGQEINVTTDLNAIGDEEKIVIDYQDLVNSTKVGNYILIADGTISFSIIEINKEKGLVKCRVNNTAVLGENKNVHLPGAKVHLPAVSEKDKQDLLFGVEQSKRVKWLILTPG